MLRAGAKGPNGQLVVVGLSDGNVNKLKAGHPIRAELKSFGLDVPGHLLIFWGPTEADMEQAFRGWGLIGPDTRVEVDPKLDQEAAKRADARPSVGELSVCNILSHRTKRGMVQLEQDGKLVARLEVGQARQVAQHLQEAAGVAEAEASLFAFLTDCIEMSVDQATQVLADFRMRRGL